MNLHHETEVPTEKFNVVRIRKEVCMVHRSKKRGGMRKFRTNNDTEWRISGDILSY